jgi:hypothetical protein
LASKEARSEVAKRFPDACWTASEVAEKKEILAGF